MEIQKKEQAHIEGCSVKSDLMVSGQILKFNLISDGRGSLVSLEENSNIPFNIKRAYYLFDLGNSPRGFHSHKNLQQVMICIAGSLKLTLEDASGRKDYLLNNASEGIFIGPSTWREMSDFKDGTVVIVIASEVYDESDYIRDYYEFKGTLS